MFFSTDKDKIMVSREHTNYPFNYGFAVYFDKWFYVGVASFLKALAKTG